MKYISLVLTVLLLGVWFGCQQQAPTIPEMDQQQSVMPQQQTPDLNATLQMDDQSILTQLKDLRAKKQARLPEIIAQKEKRASVINQSHKGYIRVPVDYPTIQEAVDAAAPGDKIKVYPGTYREVVWIYTDNLTITASSVGAAKVIGGFEIWGVNKGHLEGFRVIQAANSFAAIDVNNTTEYEVEDNIVPRGILGIWLWNCADCLVKHNMTRNLATGIYVSYGSTGNFITKNTCVRNLDGIMDDFCVDNDYVNNVCNANGKGIDLYGSSFAKLKDNTCKFNNIGFAVRRTAHHNTVGSGNVGKRNNWFGIYLYPITNDNNVYKNTFRRNGIMNIKNLGVDNWIHNNN